MATKEKLEPPSAKAPPYLEVEIRSSGDGAADGRILRLGRRQAIVATCALGLLGLFLLVGLVLVVPAALALLERREYEALISERSTQGERLQSLIGALETVGEERALLATRVGRIRFAYDLAVGNSLAETPIATASDLESIYTGLLNRGRQVAATTQAELVRLGGWLEAVEAHEGLSPERVATTPSISPLGRATFVMTSPFGTRRNPFTDQIDLHAGIDLAATTGTPIVAPADGVVTFAGRYQLRVGVAWWRFGNLVVLRHGDRFVTLFGHCEAVRVRRGQRVRRGDLIATVGNSGWSTNPHLHYEVRRADEEGRYVPFDPRIFILDQRWRDEEQILARVLQPPGDYERLPRALRR